MVLLLQFGYPVFVQFLCGMHRFNRQAMLTSVYAVIKLIGALSLIFIFGVYGAFAGFAIGVVFLVYSKDTGNAEKRKQSMVMFFAIVVLFLIAVLIRLIFLS